MDSGVKIRGFRGAGVCPNHFCSTTFKMVLVALEEVQRGRSGASPRVGSFCAVYNPDCTLLSSSFPVQLTLLLSSPLLQAHFLSLSPALLCSLKNFNSLFSTSLFLSLFPHIILLGLKTITAKNQKANKPSTTKFLSSLNTP